MAYYVKFFQNQSINDKVMDHTQPSMYFYVKLHLMAMCDLDL